MIYAELPSKEKLMSRLNLTRFATEGVQFDNDIVTFLLVVLKGSILTGMKPNNERLKYYYSTIERFTKCNYYLRSLESKWI